MISGATIKVHAQTAKTTEEKIELAVNKIQTKCIGWRRDFHEHPELSNKEFKTDK
jgi:amidohydrolase